MVHRVFPRLDQIWDRHRPDDHRRGGARGCPDSPEQVLVGSPAALCMAAGWARPARPGTVTSALYHHLGRPCSLCGIETVGVGPGRARLQCPCCPDTPDGRSRPSPGSVVTRRDLLGFVGRGLERASLARFRRGCGDRKRNAAVRYAVVAFVAVGVADRALPAGAAPASLATTRRRH